MEYLVTPERLKRMREVLKRRQRDLIVLADEVRNEHNFSALLRTCDAVGVLKVLVHAPDKPPKVNDRISMGSHQWVFIEVIDDRAEAIMRYKRQGFQVVATWLGESSVDFREVDYTKPTLLAIGNELEGVSEEVLRLADKRIVIPMHGMVQSLNVSVATGIILYEVERQRSSAGMYDKPQLSDEEIEAILKLWAKDRILESRRRRELLRRGRS